uniref:hypothetical protein n=1 Tax=Vibrio crassostreae TaxID=246167 RepID=UPI001B31216F
TVNPYVASSSLARGAKFRKKPNRKIGLFSYVTATNLFQVNVTPESSDCPTRPRSSLDKAAKFKEAASLDAAFCVLVETKAQQARL